MAPEATAFALLTDVQGCHPHHFGTGADAEVTTGRSLGTKTTEFRGLEYDTGRSIS